MPSSVATLLTIFVIKLDWIDIGDALHVQDMMNGLSSSSARQNISVALQLAECEEDSDLTASKFRL